MTVSGAFGTLRIERDWIDVTTLGGNWQYDPDWEFVDTAGHTHWRGRDSFPTLVSVVDAVWYVEGDEMVDCHLACSLCFEPVEPGRIPAPDHLPGRVTYYLNDEPITTAQAEELIAEIAR